MSIPLEEFIKLSQSLLTDKTSGNFLLKIHSLKAAFHYFFNSIPLTERNENFVPKESDKEIFLEIAKHIPFQILSYIADHLHNPLGGHLLQYETDRLQQMLQDSSLCTAKQATEIYENILKSYGFFEQKRRLFSFGKELQNPTEGPVIIMKKPAFLLENSLNPGSIQVEEYKNWLLLKRLFQKLECRVDVIEPEYLLEYTTSNNRHIFTRDPVIPIPEHKTAIFSNKTGLIHNIHCHAQETRYLIETLKKKGFTNFIAFDHLLQGGQVPYITEHKTLLIGVQDIYDEKRYLSKEVSTPFYGFHEIFFGKDQTSQTRTVYLRINEEIDSFHDALKKLRLALKEIDPDIKIELINITRENDNHLDNILGELEFPDVLCDPRFLTETSRQKIFDIYGKENIIFLDKDSALHGAANCVSIGRNVILPYASEALQEKLRSKKYTVHLPGMYGKGAKFWYGPQEGGGGPHCVSLGPFYT